MHDYLYTIDVVRFAFMFGLVVSMFMYERRHLTTGSIVVPGYIAIFLVQPMVLLATFANAGISYVLMNRVLPRWVLLFGRTKFVVLVMISIAIQALMLEFSPTGQYLWENDVPLIVAAGYVVPALIAHDMARQGVAKTVKAVVVGGSIVAMPIFIALAFGLSGVNDLSVQKLIGGLSIEGGWVPFAVLLSAGVAWALLQNYGLRAGGFVGAAYLGMLTAEPLQVVFVLVVGFITYQIVSRGMIPWMLLFGRRKFAATLLVAASISWILLAIGQEISGLFMTTHMAFAAVSLTPLFLPGLIANDMERAGVVRVLAGAALGAVFIVPTVWTLQDVFSGHPPHPGLVLVAFGSGVTIFRPQLARFVVRLRRRHPGETAEESTVGLVDLRDPAAAATESPDSPQSAPEAPPPDEALPPDESPPDEPPPLVLPDEWTLPDGDRAPGDRRGSPVPVGTGGEIPAVIPLSVLERAPHPTGRHHRLEPRRRRTAGTPHTRLGHVGALYAAPVRLGPAPGPEVVAATTDVLPRTLRAELRRYRRTQLQLAGGVVVALAAALWSLWQ